MVAISALASARAEPPGLAERELGISLGVFDNRPKANLRADGEIGEGTPVDWGNTFGDAQARRFLLDGIWRFQPSHHARLMYTNYSRSRDAVLREDIEWNGHRLARGSGVEGTLRFEVVEAAYEYDFARAANRDLAVSIGIHAMAFEAEIAGAAVGATEDRAVDSTASLDAPLPALGVRGMWHLGADFYLKAQAQYFSLTRGRYDGRLINFRAMLIWQPTWIGMGIGYDHFDLRVDVDEGSYRGQLNWRYRGPQIFVSLAF